MKRSPPIGKCHKCNKVFYLNMVVWCLLAGNPRAGNYLWVCIYCHKDCTHKGCNRQ